MTLLLRANRVTALEMSPADDTFLSGSLDDTVRLWDLRSEKSAVRAGRCMTLIAVARSAALTFGTMHKHLCRASWRSLAFPMSHTTLPA